MLACLLAVAVAIASPAAAAPLEGARQVPPVYFRLKGTNLCIDNTDGNLNDGNQLQYWECTPGNINQQWYSDLEGAGTATLVGTDKCLAFKRPSKGSSDGAPVVLAACNSDPAIYYTKWQWYDNTSHGTTNICSRINKCISGKNKVQGHHMGMTTTSNGDFEAVYL